jgi:hypothetical protein
MRTVPGADHPAPLWFRQDRYPLPYFPPSDDGLLSVLRRPSGSYSLFPATRSTTPPISAVAPAMGGRDNVVRLVASSANRSDHSILLGNAKLAGTEQSDNLQMARYFHCGRMPITWFCPRFYRRLVQLSLQSCALPSCLLSLWPCQFSLLPLLLISRLA